MLTVLSNTRSSNLYLIAALAVIGGVLLFFAFAPDIVVQEPVVIPATSNSDMTSDYFQRHPELRMSSLVVPNQMDDFALRHPELIVPVEDTVEASDYFQRHPELRQPPTIDLSDYFLRH